MIEERLNYPLRLLLRCMKASRSAYYAWAAKAKRPGEKEGSIRAAVKDVFYFHKRRYGSRRVSDELKESGVKAGRFMVTRVMREEGLKAKYPRAFQPRTTDSRHNKQPNPNLLKEASNPVFGPGEAIVGDITYLPLILNWRILFWKKWLMTIFVYLISKRMCERNNIGLPNRSRNL